MAAVDFFDDPFKDYRYEDPFNIKDPFDDDDGDVDVDPFASPAKETTKTAPSPASLKNPSTLFQQQQQQHSTSSESLSSMKNNNIVHVQKSTTIPPTVASDFFDKFSTTYSPTPARMTSPTSGTDFFAAFNDNFNKNAVTTDLDPFGGGTAESTASKTTNNGATAATAFNNGNDLFSNDDNFGDEFSKIKIDTNFAKFDAFDDAFSSSGGLAATKNHNTIGSTEKKADAAEKKNFKFESDYSVGETFDKDLHEILQRSLVDQ